jgi:syntaxin 5
MLSAAVLCWAPDHLLLVCDGGVQVAAQGEMAQRIDENVEETLGNVDNAKQQLLRYLNNMNSNRWLTAKILAVLIVFVVIFVVFIA